MASTNFQDKSIWHTFLISPIPVPCLIKTSNSEWDWIIVPVSCGHMESCWYVFTECLLRKRVLEGQNTTWDHIADTGQSLTPNLPLCGVLSSGVLQPHVCSVLDYCERPVQLGTKTASSKENINELEQNKERTERKLTKQNSFVFSVSDPDGPQPWILFCGYFQVGDRHTERLREGSGAQSCTLRNLSKISGGPLVSTVNPALFWQKAIVRNTLLVGTQEKYLLWSVLNRMHP